MLHKLNRVKVLAPAVAVWNPFPRTFAIVQVQHGSHRIHPKAVYVILFYPKQRVCNQEIFYFLATVVEN
jgi:hypothetical protein